MMTPTLQIHEHILIHGDIRKKATLQIAGETVEVEEYLDNDDEEGAVKHETGGLAARHSFIVMRDRLKARGVDVRASLDFSHGPFPPGFGSPPVHLEQGCVILAVTDMYVCHWPPQALIPCSGEGVLLPLGSDTHSRR